MSAVAVQPEYYNARIGQLLESFSTKVLLVEGTKAANLGARMMRSQEVFQLLTEYSTNAQKDAFRGICLVDYSAPQHLFKEFKAVVAKCFQAKIGEYKKGQEAKEGSSTPHDVVFLWKELQRVVAECCSLMQYAELHDQHEKTPKNIREIVYGLYAEAWAGELTEISENALCTELVRHREGNDDQALVNAKASFMLRMAITAPSLRDQAYAKIEERYISALRSYLGSAVKVPADIREYIHHINEIIDQERARAEFVLGKEETLAKAKLNIQKELVADRAMTIINDTANGVAACIQYPELRIGEFRLLYNAFEFDKPSLEKMRTALGQAVGKAIQDSTQRNGGTFNISQTIQIKAAYGNLVKSGVPAVHGIDFHLAVQNGLVGVIPHNGTFEEALVSKLDAMIRSRDTPLTRATLSAPLDSLSLIPSTELFSAHYKKALATRLLLKRDPNLKVERMVVTELTRVRGSTFAKHFAIMVEDASRQPVLCNAAVWPSGFSGRVAQAGASSGASDAPAAGGGTASPVPTALAPAISSAFAEFVMEQKKRHPKCDVWVDSDHSVVELTMDCPGTDFTCRVLATTAQAQTLIAFDTQGAAGGNVALSADELAPLVGPITRPALGVALLTLKEAALLHKDSATGKYTINKDYMKGAKANKKVALPTVGPKRQ